MINFYNKLPKDIKQETKLGKDFKDHYILPHSMIAIIGGTGSGKSNALLNLISNIFIMSDFTLSKSLKNQIKFDLFLD